MAGEKMKEKKEDEMEENDEEKKERQRGRVVPTNMTFFEDAELR